MGVATLRAGSVSDGYVPSLTLPVRTVLSSVADLNFQALQITDDPVGPELRRAVVGLAVNVAFQDETAVAHRNLIGRRLPALAALIHFHAGARVLGVDADAHGRLLGRLGRGALDAAAYSRWGRTPCHRPGRTAPSPGLQGRRSAQADRAAAASRPAAPLPFPRPPRAASRTRCVAVSERMSSRQSTTSPTVSSGVASALSAARVSVAGQVSPGPSPQAVRSSRCSRSTSVTVTSIQDTALPSRSLFRLHFVRLAEGDVALDLRRLGVRAQVGLVGVVGARPRSPPGPDGRPCPAS